jgi:hypothetical protein
MCKQLSIQGSPLLFGILADKAWKSCEEVQLGFTIIFRVVKFCENSEGRRINTIQFVSRRVIIFFAKESCPLEFGG